MSEIHTYSEPGIGSVNSFWILTAEGVVVLDAQRTLSSAANLLAEIETMGKPLLGVLVSHPHPDHIGGLAALHRAYPDAPIFASKETHDILQTDAQGYIKLSKQVLGDDFDAHVPLPTRLLQDGEEFALAGLRFQAIEAGHGEAQTMLMFFLPDENALFCADVVQHEMTAFLLEGHLDAWLRQLETVSAKYGSIPVVYPGHGVSADGAVLFAYQKAYLTFFRQQIVERLASDGTLSPEGKQSVVAAMGTRYPNYLPVAEIPDLLEQNVDAVVKELQTAASPA